MKYIHIVQFHLMSGGGVGSVITDLCEAMAKDSSEVYVISLFRRDGIDFDAEKAWAEQYGIHVLLMQDKPKNCPFRVLYKLRKTLKMLSLNDECCLYLHLKWGVLSGIVGTLNLKNIRRVEVYHSGYMNYRLQAFLSKPFINKYIAVSEDAKRQLEKCFYVASDKIVVAYNGVDIEHIKRLAENPVEHKSEIAFLSVGRLSFEKGFLTSIEAFRNLQEGGKLHNCSYTMIGQGVQMDEAKAIGKGYVNFMGVIPRDSVYGNIAGCDVMILPSWWEGNSILLLEVLCVGKPLIVTDIPSFREVLNFEPLHDDEIFRIESFGAVFRAKSVGSCELAIMAIKENIHRLDSMAKVVGCFADKYSINKQAEVYKAVATDVFSN